MILSRSTFTYSDQILIEKMTIRPPLLYEAIFQNKGCFIYFKERGPKLLSSEVNAQLKSNEAVLLNCGNHFLDLLQEKEDEQVEVVVVHLYPEVLKKLYIGELPEIIEKQTENKRSKVVASSDVISRFIESLEFYFQNPSLVNNDLLELKIKELILLLVQSNYVHSILDLVSDLYSAKTVHFKEVIELHAFSNLKLEQLAQLCNMSLSSFKREFKKAYNDSPNNFFIGKKLEKAKELLKMTDMPISEVAYETGFQDPLYFTRLFKKRIGIAPTNFRTEK